ncbi:interferon a3-like [Scomber scombrus]|uniref:Interferon a3-like n=1 Tax=Scomber scombrus TaxID=13677 RepID=A0AAV1P011_SCOSC
MKHAGFFLLYGTGVSKTKKGVERCFKRDTAWLLKHSNEIISRHINMLYNKGLYIFTKKPTNKMMNRICFALFVLSLSCADSSTSCGDLGVDAFRHRTRVSYKLLNETVTNSTKITEDAELEVDIPHNLYDQVSKASVRERRVFVKQVLNEISKLLKKDHSSASWDKKKVQNFQRTLIRQTYELRHCNGSSNPDLTKYFHNLSDHITQMDNNSTKTTEDAELEVDFPHNLYDQVSKASTRHRLVFIVQVLKDVFKLLEKNHTSASWEEQSEENFLNLVIRQTHELRHCIGSHSHKWKNDDLNKYFHALSDHITKMGHSAEVWELIRMEIQTHLFRVDQLASSLLTNN